ncbi:MAG: hypothetical protein RLZZ399_2923 [Verrucomicrobiota bacterium]|jgi:hypothetical protein
MGLEVIHAGHPIGLYGGSLLTGVLVAVAFDFNDEVEKVLGALAVGNLQPEMVVLGIGADEWMGLRNPA